MKKNYWIALAAVITLLIVAIVVISLRTPQPIKFISQSVFPTCETPNDPNLPPKVESSEAVRISKELFPVVELEGELKENMTVERSKSSSKITSPLSLVDRGINGYKFR
jgi:flagellar basal body-associated protein FliL